MRIQCHEGSKLLISSEENKILFQTHPIRWNIFPRIPYIKNFVLILKWELQKNIKCPNKNVSLKKISLKVLQVLHIKDTQLLNISQILRQKHTASLLFLSTYYKTSLLICFVLLFCLKLQWISFFFCCPIE